VYLSSSLPGFQQQMIYNRPETGGNIQENPTLVRSGVISGETSHVKPQMSSEAANRLVDRPKLNLKPRSQPLDHSIGGTQKERLVIPLESCSWMVVLYVLEIFFH